MDATRLPDRPLTQADDRYMDGHYSQGARSAFKETGEIRTSVWGGWHDAADLRPIATPTVS